MQSRKRFTECSIWEDSWFMDLTPQKKLFWFYLNNHCDNIGIWSPNLRLVGFYLKIDSNDINRFSKEFLDEVNIGEERIRILNSGSWLLIDFVRFQYCKSKGLNPKNPAHRSYLELMKSQKLFSWFCENQPEVLPEYELKKYLDSCKKTEVNKTSKRPLLEVSESYKEKEADKVEETYKETDKDIEKDLVRDKAKESDLEEGEGIYKRSNSIQLSKGKIKKNDIVRRELTTDNLQDIANDLLSIFPKQSYEIFFEEQIKCEDALKSLVKKGYTLKDAALYLEEKIIEIRKDGGSLVGLLDGIKFNMKNRDSTFSHPSSLANSL